MAGRINPRDPRALRRGLVDTSMPPAVDKKSGPGFGVAVLVMLLMFVVGAGGAFGYWKFTTPKLPVNNGAPSATTTPNASPSASPKASPSATQHAFIGPEQQVAIVTVSRA